MCRVGSEQIRYPFVHMERPYLALVQEMYSPHFSRWSVELSLASPLRLYYRLRVVLCEELYCSSRGHFHMCRPQ